MTPDAWTHLKAFTAARIALGRSGASLPTRQRLAFQLALARARDAVHAPFDPAGLASQLAGLPVSSVLLASNASDRPTYLQRPDLGRHLATTSHQLLEFHQAKGPWDLVIVLSDGLSPLATLRQARPLLAVLLPKLLPAGWRVAPLMILANARVAVQDEIGGLLSATLSLMLLGERPGLDSPDSLGAYFTFQPRPGKTDADRNCVSNIRPEGLPPEAAAEKLFALLTQSRQRQLSGVGLKDEGELLIQTGHRDLTGCDQGNELA
jgi:ethanolamine ammonia-lyase small subunit